MKMKRYHSRYEKDYKFWDSFRNFWYLIGDYKGLFVAPILLIILSEAVQMGARGVISLAMSLINTADRVLIVFAIVGVLFYDLSHYKLRYGYIKGSFTTFDTNFEPDFWIEFYLISYGWDPHFTLQFPFLRLLTGLKRLPT